MQPGPGALLFVISGKASPAALAGGTAEGLGIRAALPGHFLLQHNPELMVLVVCLLGVWVFYVLLGAGGGSSRWFSAL